MTTATSSDARVKAVSVARQPTRLARVGIHNVVTYWILIVVAALILVPLGFAVLGGFKSNGQLVGDPGAIIPSPWVTSNYTDILVGPNAGVFWQEVLNSLIVAVIAVTATVIPASLAAFAFARIAFRGRETIYTLFTFGLLFPAAVAILPLYILVRDLGLSGNFLGVALPEAAFGLPLTVIILRPFFRSIPVELEDAARIDGCTTFGFFWRVLLPLARPAIATVSVLATVTTWNAFLLPLILLNGENQWTLPLGVMNFSGTYSSDQARILAFTVLAIMPAILFYAVAERQIVRGLTAGSVKG
jgi:raffinose/stachyose/melibiose transport system permease protein